MRLLQDLRRARQLRTALGVGPWLDLLKDCQREIASLDPHPHYLASYRSDEPFYWSHLPQWIYSDFAKGGATRCLDIGCAYGTLLVYTHRVTGCEASGIDFVDHYVSKSLLAKYRVRFQVCNIEVEPFPWDGSFDIILFTEVLEHLNFQCVPTLTGIGERLSPQGRLYLSTPDAAEWGITTKYYGSYQDLPLPCVPMPEHEPIDDHIWHFSLPELLACLAEARLRVIRLEYSRPPRGKRHFNATLCKQAS